VARKVEADNSNMIAAEVTLEMNKDMTVVILTSHMTKTVVEI